MQSSEASGTGKLSAIHPAQSDTQGNQFLLHDKHMRGRDTTTHITFGVAGFYFTIIFLRYPAEINGEAGFKKTGNKKKKKKYKKCRFVYFIGSIFNMCTAP